MFICGYTPVSYTHLRHRIASFSVQSQRYVGQSGEDGIDYILPPEIEKLGDEYVKRFADQRDMMDKWYREWRELLGEGGKEDARFVLPNAAATRMVCLLYTSCGARDIRRG